MQSFFNGDIIINNDLPKTTGIVADRLSFVIFSIVWAMYRTIDHHINRLPASFILWNVKFRQLAKTGPLEQHFLAADGNRPDGGTVGRQRISNCVHAKLADQQ